KCVVESLVVEHRGSEIQRWYEAVDRRKPLLAIAEVRRQLEPSGPLAEPDAQNSLTVAVDEIERAPWLLAAQLTGVVEHLRRSRERHAVRGDCPTRGAQQHVQRVTRAPAVEHVARVQRELLDEGARQLPVDAL